MYFCQWDLDPAFEPRLDGHAELNEVARVAMDTLDYRLNSVATVVQYNLYCDGSFTFQVHATTKTQGADKKTGWALGIAAQTTPRAEDEVIVGIASGPLFPQEMFYHGLDNQAAETAAAFAIY